MVKSVIKKASLDKNVIVKRYRPVSNIVLISKLIKEPAIKQLQDYLTNHDLNEPLQSAYRIHHSTETALMKVQGDILHANGDRKAVFLVMLDPSTAFDTVGHNRLIHRLSSRLNITDTGLEWVSSYFVWSEEQGVHYWRIFCYHKDDIWHAPGLGGGSLDVYQIRSSYWWYHQALWAILPTLCRWFTDIHITQPSTKRYLAMRRFASSRSELA